MEWKGERYGIKYLSMQESHCTHTLVSLCVCVRVHACDCFKSPLNSFTDRDQKSAVEDIRHATRTQIWKLSFMTGLGCCNLEAKISRIKKSQGAPFPSLSRSSPTQPRGQEAPYEYHRTFQYILEKSSQKGREEKHRLTKFLSGSLPALHPTPNSL